MISHTDWRGILTVEVTVVASWTAAIRGPTVSTPTVEAVVVLVITDLVEAQTLGVLSAATRRAVGAGAVHVTVTSTTLVTVSVTLALSILGTCEAAVDNIRPVTDWAQGVLERHVEGESPLAQTPGVLIQAMLTSCTLD